MKYKVIGWTNYDNYHIPFAKTDNGYAERNAIIDDIKKHGYLFSGWHHQESFENCVPILNDGKKRGFSQRGWGGLMAEAYGRMGDMDYAVYTFRESIKKEALCFPKNAYNADCFVSETLENETFEVEVSEELFEIARKENPFYLEDIDELRFLDINDTLILHCSDQVLRFFVAGVNRNKKEVKFDKPELIKGDYKIVVTHKPISKIFPKKSMIILKENVYDVFTECLKEYDLNKMMNLIDGYYISDITRGNKSEEVINLLKRFTRDYTDYICESRIIMQVLNYIDDLSFSEEIAYKTVYSCPEVFSLFVKECYEKGLDYAKHLPILSKIQSNVDFYLSDLLLDAIEFEPENKELRKKYYQVQRLGSYESFLIYMGINEFDGLLESHKRLINLYSFNNLESRDVLDIAKFMYYPTTINESNYPLRIPNFYSSKYNCIKSGIKEYQKYVNEKFNLVNRLEELFLHGIDEECKTMEIYESVETDIAQYVYALDMLSCFKYNLKDATISKYPMLEEYINNVYDEYKD